MVLGLSSCQARYFATAPVGEVIVIANMMLVFAVCHKSCGLWSFIICRKTRLSQRSHNIVSQLKSCGLLRLLYSRICAEEGR